MHGYSSNSSPANWTKHLYLSPFQAKEEARLHQQYVCAKVKGAPQYVSRVSLKNREVRMRTTSLSLWSAYHDVSRFRNSVENDVAV